MAARQMPKSQVPEIRIRAVGDATSRPTGELVLYVMTAYRRTGWNYALQRAVDWAAELGRPLAVVEPLTVGGRWDCDRFHRFVLDGMAEQARRLATRGVLYRPCVEAAPGQAAALLAELARRACVVVADDFPDAEHARADADLWSRAPVRVERVDSNGLLPLRAADRAYTSAHWFRRFLSRTLPEHWQQMPKLDPLARRKLPPLAALPETIERRWPAVQGDETDLARLIARLPIDHRVGPVATQGGATGARALLRTFLGEKLDHYVRQRNQPEADATSGLSPYLRHGHISAHEVFAAVVEADGGSLDTLAEPRIDPGRPAWGMGENAGTFVDQLVTWRELGFNAAVQVEGYDRYESLPDWARKTLAEQAGDEREHLYSLDELAAGRTADPLWNAAQGQLLAEGRIHNYLRMLWGKRVLQWTATPQEALDVLIELNNRYALDGRDPNSYSGIFWVLGRYDRPWGPRRKIFGTVRYMNSQSAMRKYRLRGYIERYG